MFVRNSKTIYPEQPFSKDQVRLISRAWIGIKILQFIELARIPVLFSSLAKTCLKYPGGRCDRSHSTRYRLLMASLARSAWDSATPKKAVP